MMQNFVLIVGLMISALALTGGLITVWVNTNVKIAKIETTLNLKVAAIELSIAGYIQSNTEIMRCNFADNRAEHQNLIADVKEVRELVHNINLHIAKTKS
jgi:hypothetical protein